MSLSNAILFGDMLLSICCFLQALEIYKSLEIFKQSNLLSKNEFLLRVFAYSLAFFSLANIVAPSIVFFVFMTGIFFGILKVFRMPLNGGSDYLIATGLICTIIAKCVPDIASYAIGYWGAQTFLSYWIAGLIKLKYRNWWNGVFLKSFLCESNYRVPIFLKTLCTNNYLLRFLSGSILLWEISAPMVFLGTKYSIVFLCVAFIFHLTNFVAFGLNRFLWAWGAAYPALLYLTNK